MRERLVKAAVEEELVVRLLVKRHLRLSSKLMQAPPKIFYLISIKSLVCDAESRRVADYRLDTD